MKAINKIITWFELQDTTIRAFVTFNAFIFILGFILGLCKLIFWR